MKVLSVEEMDNVSGAYGDNMVANVGEFIASVALGASVGSIMWAFTGGKHGGDGGGLIGAGIIGQLVGMTVGLVWGGVTMGVAAGVVGWDATTGLIDNMFSSWFDGTWVP